MRRYFLAFCWVVMGAILISPPVAFANHDLTTPQLPGLSGTEVLYVLAKDRYLVVDPVNLTVLKTVQVGGCFVRLLPAGDGRVVYASNPCLNALVVIDPRTHEVAELLRVGNGPGGDLRLSPDFQTLWVRTIDGVAVIDAAKRKLVAHIPTGDAKSPWGPGASSSITFLPAKGDRPTMAYVANPTDNTVTAIDVSRRVKIATVPVGLTPRSIAYSKLSDEVYVLSPASKEIFILAPSTNRVVKRIKVTQEGLGSIAFTHNGRFASIDSRHEGGGGDSLVILDARTDSIVGTIPTHPSGMPTTAAVNPSRLFFTPDDKLGFAIQKTSPNVSVVDVATLKLVKTIELRPQETPVLYRCSVLVSRDGRTVYVTSAVEETITAIDVASLSVRTVVNTHAPTCSIYDFVVGTG